MRKPFLDSLKSFVGSWTSGPGDVVSRSIYGGTGVDSMYENSWLPRKIVDIPADDATREWRDWQAEADQIEKIEEEEMRLDLQRKVLQAMKMARLYGGSAIYLGTADADLSEPLDLDRIGVGGLAYITVMGMNALTAGEKVTDPANPYYNRPEFYELAGQAVGSRIRYHASRFVFLTGNQSAKSSFVPDTWGDSVLTSILTAISNADSTAGNVAALVFEAKVDVFQIDGLMEHLSDPEYERKLLSRLSLASAGKGIGGALIMDKSEEYSQKTASFSQLPDIIDRFYQIVSGAADIPYTRLMGMSPAGMNATGESDLRNYYDRIAAYQKTQLSPALRNLDECLIRSALGVRPPEVHFVWGSLWQMSDTERAAIGKVISETITNLNNTGLFQQEALATAAANALIEASVLPGLQEAIDEAGGMPDFDQMEAEANQREIDKVAAITAAKGGNVVPLARVGAKDDDSAAGDPSQAILEP